MRTALRLALNLAGLVAIAFFVPGVIGFLPYAVAFQILWKGAATSRDFLRLSIKACLAMLAIKAFALTLSAVFPVVGTASRLAGLVNAGAYMMLLLENLSAGALGSSSAATVFGFAVFVSIAFTALSAFPIYWLRGHKSGEKASNA